MEDYTTTLKECIDECKNNIVILIDCLDEVVELDDLSWMPTQLNDHVKMIITTTSTIGEIDNVNESESVLWNLKSRVSKENFLRLDVDESPIQAKVRLRCRFYFRKISSKLKNID